MQTLSSAVVSSTKNILGQAGKIGVPVMALLAAIADAAEPLGPFALVLAVVLMIVGAISGAVYYLHFRRRYLLAMADGKLTEEEGRKLLERNVWSVCYSFCAVGSMLCWLLVGLQQISDKDDRGFLGSTLQPIAKLQDSLFAIEKDVATIKGATDAIQQSTSRIEGKVDAVRSDLKSAAASMESVGSALTALGKLGGLVADPKNAAEFVHNARLQVGSGAYGPARAAFERAFELGYRPLDVAREYVDSVVARDGADLALPMILRWLDPSGSVYSVAQGKPVVAAGRVAGDGPLTVEAAASALVRDWADRRTFLRALLGKGERSLPIAIAVVAAVEALPAEKRTRADNLLLRDALAEAEPVLSSRALETLYLDALRAAAARESLGAAKARIAGWSDAYWKGEPEWRVSSDFNRISIGVLVPDRAEKFSCSYRGQTFAARLLRPDDEQEVPPAQQAWSQVSIVNVDSSMGYWPAVEGVEPLTVTYTPLGGAEPVILSYSLDNAAVCLAEVRSNFEGVQQIRDGGRVLEQHGPGVHALRPELRAMGFESAVRRVSEKSFRRDQQAESHKCYAAYWMCEQADPTHKGFRCGKPWVSIQTVPDYQEGPASVDLENLLQWRHAFREIRYSVGSAALDQRVEFTPLPVCVADAGIARVALALDDKGRPPLLKATGGETVEGNSIRIADRFAGPIYFQLVYKDGRETQVVRYDLINANAPPEGYPERALARPSKESAKATPAAKQAEVGLGAGITEQTRTLPDGTVETATFRKPYGYENELGGLVPHGRRVVRSKAGKLVYEALVADGLSYATIAYDEEERPKEVVCQTPLWEEDVRQTPSAACIYGPRLLFRAGVLDEGESRVYGDPDRAEPFEHFADDHQRVQRPLTAEELAWARRVTRVDDLIQEVAFTLTTASPRGNHGARLDSRYLAAFPLQTRQQEMARQSPFSRGRGLFFGGLPLGWWSELDDSGRVRAQGWVCRRLAGEGRPSATRMGRWSGFDGEGRPEFALDYEALGEPMGVFVTVNPEGKATSFGLVVMGGRIRACWAQDLPFFSRESEVTEAWARKRCEAYLPIAGPTR